MRNRLTALIMAVLMLLQLLPVLAVAETVGEIISDVLTAPEMHTVSFCVDGESIHTIFVQDGSALGTLPDAPEFESRQFEGWYFGEELLTADYIVSANVTAEAVYTNILSQTVEKTFEFGGLVLNGMVPENVTVDAADVTEKYAAYIKNETVVTAWGISIGQNSAEHIPDGGYQLTAAVKVDVSSRESIWKAWKVLPDGDCEEIKAAYEEGTVIFGTAGSGIYLITESIPVHIIRATDDATYDISVKYDSAAKLPAENLALMVTEITEKDPDYEAYIEAAAGQLGARVKDIDMARAFDIRIVSAKDPDTVIQPTGNVQVTIRLPGEVLGEYEHVDVLHFERMRGSRFAVTDIKEAVDGDEITFTTDSFSIYVVAGYTLEKIIEASDGNTYRISVTFGRDALLPDGAELEVEELQGEELADYVGRTAVAMNAAGFEYARVFDISIVGEDGTVLQPGAEVQVSIELLDAKNTTEDFSVMHFGEETADQVAAVTEGNVVTFGATGFSAYAIVQGPEPVSLGWEKVNGMSELAALGPQGVYMSHIDGYYFTDGITTISTNPLRTGITKTKPPTVNPPDAAVLYYFEAQSGTNQYKVYCLAGATKKYIYQNANNSLNLTEDVNQATTFTVQQGTDSETFRVRGNNGYYWNMQGGANGKSFAAYNKADDVNAQLHFWYATTSDPDPYNLDGKAYGLMNWTGNVAGRALMGTSSAAGTLDAKALTVMTHKQDHEDKLFVPSDSDITMWTFEWAESDRYYLKATVDGSTKYVSITSSGLSLVSTPDTTCKLQVVPGVGAHAGQICLIAGGVPLTYSGNINVGFTTTGTAGSEWLYMVDLDTLTSDYYRIYSAIEVGVSDPSVTNGSRIIVYSRVWNDTTKEYEYYAIDHDGKLVRCYESGNELQWVSGQLNTMLWNLVEYYYEGTNEPNYYYELYNQYSEKFIAPQVTGNQIFSGDTIGINLNGRRNGEYYSTVIAWDKTAFTYAYLKADRENGQIITIPQAESMQALDAVEFCFAIVQDLEIDDNLQTVPTVDHERYGITMKIIDIDTREEMSNFLGNDEGGIGTTLHQGLLSNSLGTDGYPTAQGGSLGQLYQGARQVNHLFLEGTYNSTGYFEFDSTQNFASLHSDDNFVVYREIATYDRLNRNTLKHGQFFPFNDIEAGVYASVNGKNLYDVNANPLSEDDPRKYEQLYLIRNDDCYFAVELEASFVQTPNGLDAWGHDIIYQFTGDDDFWLYVDGELVIDLGGIHSAVPGSVNYRTGDVYVNGNHTTLKDIFYNNYLSRDGHTAAQAQAYVDEIFELSSEGYYVFKANTTHTMKIFYMERGAGASNLKMKFNLSSVKKGTVLLNKQLNGVDPSETILAEFPFQIRYSQDNGTHYVTANENETATVVYKGTNKDVKFLESLTIDGIEYTNVFLLKPGETAEIDFGLGTDVLYEIVECGINTDVYSSVTVNGEAVTGTPIEGHPKRMDYKTGFESTKNRAHVNYVNTVDPEARRTLSITKRVYKEDGETLLEPGEDSGMFNFRLYLATEFDSSLTGANMYTYHIKDLNGNYCKWDVDLQTFVPIREGITNYNDLTAEEKILAGFSTSPNGSISSVPSNFTVEVRQLLAGTQFMVEERSNEIPDGYSLQNYTYNETILDPGVLPQGTMTTEQDEDIIVYNHRGFGLRVNKIWSDKDYMTVRDAAYFALFVPDAQGQPVLVEDSVRQMPYGTTTLYWYYLTLPVEHTGMNDYSIREVTLTGTPTVDSEGVVIGYTSATPIGEGGTVTLNGKQKGEDVSSAFHYTVHYRTGTIAENSTVRVDTVTNSRPGIIFNKQDWDGHALAGATFTLKDDTGSVIGTFTSDAEGRITDAFLRENVDYTLTETSVPQGYQGIETPVTVRMEDGDVTVTGVSADYYTLTPGTDTTKPVVTIKNRPYTFEVIKVNGDTPPVTLAGAHFELHKQKTVDGVTAIDLNPEPGYTDLVTGTDGVIPGIDNTLPAGTYELWETQAPSGGYMDLGGHIRFTISPMHVITLGTVPDGVALETNQNTDDGSISYVITVENDLPKLTLTKIVSGSFANYDQLFTFTIVVTGAQSGDAYSYIKETATGTVTGTIASGGTFTLKDSETITLTLPANLIIRLTENDNANGIYQKTWTKVSGSDGTASNNRLTVTLDEDSAFTIENHLDPVSPTGYHTDSMPYLWILGAGILLLFLKCFRKKRLTEEGGWSS